MKKWLFFLIAIITIFAFTGCSGSSSDETEENQLEVYSSMNHDFIEKIITHFKEIGNRDSLQDGNSDSLVDGNRDSLQVAVMATLKIVGTVAQIAYEVKTVSDTIAFRASVSNDLSDIKENLDNLENQVKKGFNNVNAKLAESEVLDTWNSLCDNHLIAIDTAWNHYLDPDGIEGLINILDKEDVSAEAYQDAVVNFIATIDSRIYAIEEAMEAIRNHIDGSYSPILKQVVDYLSLKYNDAYKNQEAFDSIFASYLNFYMQMINYELKGTILLSEYYNYTEVDSEEVVLTEDGYATITSETAQRKYESFLSDFKKQLTSFVNCGEQLISQFNAGDIYREYESSDELVINSNYFPYIDYFIKIAYEYENAFVFRLAWSEELVSNNPDGSMEFSDYEKLYEGLSDSLVDIDFILKQTNDIYHPEIDEDNPLNLSCVSTFKLHPEDDSTVTFNGGVRRYVFQGFYNHYSKSELLMSNSDLVEDFTFDFNPLCTEKIHLFAANNIEFQLSDLLEKNNPLAQFNNNPQCISFTLGAYMSEHELVKDELFSPMSKELQAEYLFGVLSSDYYHVETAGNQHIELDNDKPPAFFTVVPADDTSSSGIKDGDKVVMYMDYEHSNKTHRGYMYQKNHKSGKPIKFKEGLDNAIEFTIHKKYLYPSGKLYSDSTINKLNIFVLETGDVCVHAMSAADDRRLEFYNTDYTNENNWFFVCP